MQALALICDAWRQTLLALQSIIVLRRDKFYLLSGRFTKESFQMTSFTSLFTSQITGASTSLLAAQHVQPNAIRNHFLV